MNRRHYTRDILNRVIHIIRIDAEVSDPLLTSRAGNGQLPARSGHQLTNRKRSTKATPMTLKPAVSLVLVWILFVTALPSTAARAVTKQDNDSTDEKEGLQFRLSEVTEPAVAASPSSPTVAAENLSEAETRKLLARLPVLEAEPSDAVNFKLRERSLPPPRAGETIQAAFAPLPTEAPPASNVTNAALEVTRFAPEGEVKLAPNLTVTFSQSMVAVSSQAEAAANVPVTLTPQPAGKWRWLGTQTLMFQPEAEGGRLPMATGYTVTIPAGTKSALGNTLRETKTFNFSTPPPQLRESSYPQGEGKPRDALMFLEFDQRIEPARVLEHIKLEPNSDTRLRLATPEEIAADEAVSDLVKRATEGRWLVFRAVDSKGATQDALPSGTLIKVDIASGTPSAEGTRATAQEQSFTFKTYDPMRVTAAQCGYQQRCAPFEDFRITFNNQFATEGLQPGQVKISPEIPDVKIHAPYDILTIAGSKRSNTTYTVTLDRAIKDRFGQTLTGDNVFTFKVTTNGPSLFAAGGAFVVLDPAGPRAFTVYSVNYTRLRVALYKVGPDDWQQFRRYLGVNYANSKEPTPRPGRLVSDKVIDLNVDPDQLTETSVDLSVALDNGLGHVFVRVDPVEREEDKGKPVTVYANRRNIAEAWVESTEIGLDAFADHKELVAWTNSLKDGSPLAGVELSVSPDDITGVSGANGLARP